MISTNILPLQWWNKPYRRRWEAGMFKSIVAIFKRLFGYFGYKEPTIIVVKQPQQSEPLKFQESSSPWKAFSAVYPGDNEHIIKATFYDEFGTPKTYYCMAVFETESEYKFVAPDIDPGIVVQKANITDFKAPKIPKTERQS